MCNSESIEGSGAPDALQKNDCRICLYMTEGTLCPKNEYAAYEETVAPVVHKPLTSSSTPRPATVIDCCKGIDSRELSLKELGSAVLTLKLVNRGVGIEGRRSRLSQVDVLP